MLPAVTSQTDAAGTFPFTLQAMSADVTSWTGLLLGGARTHSVVEVEESVQKYWRVVWAVACVAKREASARSGIADFILNFVWKTL